MGPGRLIALAGGLVLTLVLAGFFIVPVLKELRLVGGVGYTAELATASGVRPGDQVRVAGIRTGRVYGVKLAGDRVRMSFRMDESVPLGRETTVEVKLGSIFGQRVVEVHPAGPGKLDRGHVFPLEKTQVPFTIQDLASTASQQLGGIDIDLMNRSVQALIVAIKDTPEPAQELIGHLSKLSVIMASKTGDLDKLLAQSNQLSGVLARQREAFGDLFEQGAQILHIIKVRREAIHKVIIEIEATAARFRKLAVALDKDAQQALESLNAVAKVMRDNEKSLIEIYEKFPVVSRYVANLTGDGPYGKILVTHMPDNWRCSMPGFERACQ